MNKKRNLFKRISTILKVIFYNWIVSFTQKINLWKDKLIDDSIHPNPNNFDDLTPTSDGDKDHVYSETLKWALENKKITNIALTGSIGSGKSSILKTFEKEHCEYRYLNISLASFKEEDTDERLIELSILQQIFYHVKHRNIPDSRFKRIKSIRRGNILFKSLGLIIWISSILIYFKISFITQTLIWQKLSDKPLPIKNNIYYLSFAVFIIGFVYLIAKSIRVFNNAKLNKLKIQSSEIELGNDKEQSILNKHIDEILYFFEVIKYNVVIIEDLDRFKDTEIFTKLRELNLLINRSKQINRHIVFIYAIRDDKFQNENRTKFFDFIIPIIPVINPSNSGAILLEKLKNNELSNEFIEDVSMYIEDMRLLKNIYNEFSIYKNKLGKQLSQDKLFAIIIYKNFYPSDFAELQNNKGDIYNIFGKKGDIIKQQIELVDKEIENLTNDIKAIETVCLKNIEELRSLYIFKFNEKMPNACSIQINGVDTAFSNLKNDANFSSFRNSANFTYYFVHNPANLNYKGTSNSNISFTTLEKEVDAERNYLEREYLIKSKYENKTEKLKKEIENLTKEKNEIKSLPLQQIVNKNNVQNIFNNIINDKLIIYLLRNGYIDENYHDYISFFYEGFITKEDREFLFSIKNRIALSFSYRLNNVENVIKRIRDNEWKYTEVLNCSLIDFLLTNKESFKLQLDSVFSLLINESNKSIEFVDYYVDNGHNIPEFIKIIGAKWYNIWNFVENKSNYSATRKDRYLKLIIENLDEFNISMIAIYGNIKHYISKKDNFISIFNDEEYSTQIKSNLTKLKIEFESLVYSGNSNWLTDFIYENNHYQISFEMISFFIKLKSGKTDLAELKKANYTTLKLSNCDNLINYIENNIDQYVTNVLLKLEENTNETESSMLILLNNEKISFENKESLIENWNNKISYINQINDIQFWDTIFIYSKISAIWNNIFSYYKAHENIFDEYLIDYLNEEENYTVLANQKLNPDSVEYNEFITNLTTCNDISDESFSYLMISVPYNTNSWNFDNLSPNKITWMVNNKFLFLSPTIYSNLKEKFPQKHIELLEKYPNEYIEKYAEYPIDKGDLQKILDSNIFSFETKVTLIIANENLIINDKGLSEQSCSILSKHRYIKLNEELLKSIIQYGKSIDDKLIIFNNHIPELLEIEITEFIGLLDMPFPEIAINGKNPSIENNSTNLSFVKSLKAYDYISSYRIDRDRIRVHTKRKAEENENVEGEKSINP